MAQVHIPGIGYRDYIAIPWLISESDMIKRIREERERLSRRDPADRRVFALVRRIVTNETLIEFRD